MEITCPFYVETQQEGAGYQTGGTSPEPDHVSALILHFQPPELCKK